MNPFGLGDLEGADVLRGPSIGGSALRCDYLVVCNGQGRIGEPVFEHFRRYNIVQHIAPYEWLDLRELHKAMACAHYARRGRRA